MSLMVDAALGMVAWNGAETGMEVFERADKAMRRGIALLPPSLIELPQDLTKNAQQQRGVPRANSHATNPAPDFLLSRNRGNAVGVAGLLQNLQQHPR